MPSATASAEQPSFFSRASATFWFTALSSASRMRAPASFARMRRSREQAATARGAGFGVPRAAPRLADHGDEAVEQARLLDGFAERRVDAGGLHFLFGERLAGWGERDQLRAGDGGVGLDRAGEREAVHLGHLDVEEREVVGVALGGGGAQHAERLVPPAALPFWSFHAKIWWRRICRLVALSSTTSTRRFDQPSRSPATGGWSPGGFFELGGEPERRALARLALHADLAVHHDHELLGDRQAQAGAAVAARGRAVGLREGLEQLRLHRGRNAHAGVAHLEAEDDAVVAFGLPGDADDDFAALGELDRVADEVHEHLAQPARIAAQEARHFGRQVHDQLGALGLRALGEHVERALDGLRQVEVERFEGELAGLDLGEIEHVVDQGEQRVGAGADRLGVFALDRAELEVEEQAGHADHAVHRRADFVAHVGEELALGLGGGLGGLLGVAQLDGALRDELFEIRELELRLPREIPFFGERRGELQGLDVVEGFLEDHEFVGLAEFLAHLIPRVIRVRGADDDLDLGIDLPDARGGFDAVPARRHPDVHERHRVGPALGHGALDHFEAVLALVGRVQLEADGLARVERLAKQGRFHGAGLVGRCVRRRGFSENRRGWSDCRR
jgi:hypothetical protein